jgi:hypothetical protein
MTPAAKFSFMFRVVAVLLCLTLSPLPSLAQGSAGGGVAGSVSAVISEVTRNGKPVKAKEEVQWNDVLKSNGSGRARVALKDGSILSLGSNSELKVVQHDPATQQTVVELTYGKLRSRVVALTKPGSKFEVRTPTAVAGVIGTDFVVIVNPDGTMSLIVISGTVTIVGIGPLAGQTVTVNGGQMVNISNTGISQPQPTPNTVQTENINDTSNNQAQEGNNASQGSNLLRNILIMLGVAAVSIGIAIATSDSDRDPDLHEPEPEPTPTPTGTGSGSLNRPLRF